MFKKLANFLSGIRSRIQERNRKTTVLCGFCNRRFKFRHSDVYIAKEPQAISTVFTQPAKFFTVIDCPHCGNQIRMADYLPRCPDDEREEGQQE